MWLPAYSGHRRRAAAGDGEGAARRGSATIASSCARGSTGAATCAPSGPISPSPSTTSSSALKELYAQFTPEFAADETGVDAGADRRGGARDRPRARHLQHAQLAIGGGRQSLGLADHALPLPARRAHRIGRRRRAASACTSRTSSCRSIRARRRRRLLERAAVPARVPARLLRDELPAAAFPEGEPRPARRLLHARLQPAVDESRRLLVDGDADRSRTRSACTSR